MRTLIVMDRRGCAIFPILVFCLAALLPQPTRGETSAYEGKTIGRIVFAPQEQPVDPEELHRILPVKERTPLRLDDVRAAIKRLYATGTYSDIQVDAELRNDEVILRFITQNNWFIGRVAVLGKIKDPPTAGQLVNASRLELGVRQTDENLREAVDAIQQLFKNDGYYQSYVQPRFTYDQHTDQVHIDFVVDTGQRAKYASPQLTGDPAMPPMKIVSATGWKGWLGWKPVTQSRTQHGLQNVRKKYQKQDRLMATITLDKMDFDSDTMTVRPILNIRPGANVDIVAVGAKISRGKLQKYVPVFEEHTVDPDLLVEGQRNLRDYFQSEGYSDAEVEFKGQRAVNDKEEIDYIINLGKRHKLAKVVIDGNRYFDTQTIRERMFLLPASFQVRRGRYSESSLRRDEDAISDLYRQNGFHDVKITSKVDDDYQGKQNELAVTLHIAEGPQQIVSKLEVSGISQLDKSAILANLSCTPGQPFSEYDVAADRDYILTEYFSRGFPNATFEWSSTPGTEPNRVEVQFTVKEGQRRFVRQVLTNGLVATRAQLVNRNILAQPRRSAFAAQSRCTRDLQRRLHDLGIFSEVNAAIQNPDGRHSG